MLFPLKNWYVVLSYKLSYLALTAFYNFFTCKGRGKEFNSRFDQYAEVPEKKKEKKKLYVCAHWAGATVNIHSPKKALPSTYLLANKYY